MNKATVFTVAVLLCISMAMPAYALTFSTPLGDVDCDVVDGSLAVKTIYCVKFAVYETTIQFLAQTSELFRPVIGAIMILVVTLIGVRIATGERDPQKIAVGFALKFGIVMLFADNFGEAAFGIGGLTDEVFRIMDEMQGFVIPMLYGVGMTSNGVCEFTDPGLPNPYGVLLGSTYTLPASTYTPWQYIDCIFDYIFGFGKEATIASSIFGFIGSAFFGGYMGTMIFFLGIILVLTLALFAFRCVYITLMCYVLAGFLIMISPFIFPTIMFKQTEDMFRKWLASLINCLFLPFMMVVYLAFAIPVLDMFVFDPDPDSGSLVATLGTGEEIVEKYRLATPACQVTTPSDMEFYKRLPGFSNIMAPGVADRIIPDELNPTQSGANDWCGMADFSKIDMGEDHVQELWELGMSLIRILVGAFLILTIAKVIPDLTLHLTKGTFGMLSAMQSPMLFENTMRGAVRDSMKTMSSNASSSSGVFGGLGGIGNMMR